MSSPSNPPDLPLPPTYGPASEASDAMRLRQAILNEFLVQIGAAMTVAGDSVDRVRSRLLAISRRNGVSDVEILALPTALIIETGHGPSARVHLSSHQRASLRFDQIDELYRLAHKAEDGRVDPTEGLRRLEEIALLRSSMDWPKRVLGYGVVSTGLALLLDPTWEGLGVACLLGMLVGILHLLPWSGADLIMAVVSAYLVSIVVFWLTPEWIDNPLHTLIAPLVVLLPGSVLTIGTVELAAGQVMSGSTRLVFGLVQLALLGFGIMAANATIDVSHQDLSGAGDGDFGGWAPWAGVALYAVGIHLRLAAPRRTVPWIGAVMAAAYAGELLGATLVGPELSGFFGALVMTPLVLWIDASKHGPPSLITFLPGFWLLVPGSGGLIGVTELAGHDQQLGMQDLTQAFVTIMAIALGVLIGTAAWRAATVSMRTIADTIPSGYRIGH